MEETRYGLRVEIPVAYEQNVERATDALKTGHAGITLRRPRVRCIPGPPCRQPQWCCPRNVPRARVVGVTRCAA